MTSGVIGSGPASSSSHRPSLLRQTVEVVRDLWTWRHLVRAFVLYDIKHDKRNNVMGNVWHLLNPILNMLIFMFVFQVIFKGRQENYAIFFFVGAMFFRMWTTSFGRGTSILVQQQGMIKSCYFPRIVLIAPVTLMMLYNFLVESIVLVALLLIFRIEIGWPLLLLPGLVAVTVLGTTGTVLLLSCVGVRFRDLSNVVQHVNRLLFYFTPVMYPLTFVPERFQDLYMLNPLSCAVEAGRDIILRATVPSGSIMAYYTAFCVVLLLVGLAVFAALQRRVAKYL